MVLFFVEYFLAAVISFFDSKRNRKIILVFFGLFVFLFAFRDLTATLSDTTQYRLYYNNLDNNYIVNNMMFEPGYHLINIIFSTLGFPFEVFMIALGLFYSIAFWKISSKYTMNPGLALMPALYYMFWFSGAYRQSIAQITAYAAFFYLLQEDEEEHVGKMVISQHKLRVTELEYSVSNTVKYYVLCLIAFCFHRTAIVLFILPFFVKRKWKVIIIAAIAFLSAFLPYIERYIRMIPYVYGKYMAYKIGDDGFYGLTERGSVFSIRLLEYILIIAVMFLTKNKDKLENLALNLAEFGFIIQVFLSNYIGATYRLLLYTDFAIIFFVISVCKRFKKSIYRYGMVVAMSGYTFLRFYRVFTVSRDMNFHYALLGLGSLLT